MLDDAGEERRLLLADKHLAMYEICDFRKTPFLASVPKKKAENARLPVTIGFDEVIQVSRRNEQISKVGGMVGAIPRSVSNRNLVEVEKL